MRKKILSIMLTLALLLSTGAVPVAAGEGAPDGANGCAKSRGIFCTVGNPRFV